MSWRSEGQAIATRSQASEALAPSTVGHRLYRGSLLVAALTALCLVIACALTVGIAWANQPYFDLVNGVLRVGDPVLRAIVFSSWLVLLGGLVVCWNPRGFGLSLGVVREHGRLIVGTATIAAAVTAVLLVATGSTPYSGASIVVESLVVPFSEELVFRAVLLTVLLAVLVRTYDRPTATVLAVVFNGLAFGVAHFANLGSLAGAFVLPQVVFALALGATCAFLMARTKSVYPAMLVHGVVNAVVVAL